MRASSNVVFLQQQKQAKAEMDKREEEKKRGEGKH